MTESIFVPFRLTTREACEKAIKVLTSEPAPKVVSDQPYELVEHTPAEAREFARKVKARYAKAKES